MQKIQLWLLSCAFIASCSFVTDKTAVAKSDNTITSALRMLPPAIDESSGLVCLDNGELLTFNDSGNDPELFLLNKQGVVQRQLNLNIANVDWEAAALHQGNVVLADIGNNLGARSEFQLYLLDAKTLMEAHRGISQIAIQPHELRFVLEQQTSHGNHLFLHDFDAEAIASDGNNLWLFTKNWRSNGSNVYQLPLQANGQSPMVAKQVKSLTGLPGLVTDAAYDRQSATFWLTGYQNFSEHKIRFALTGNYSPFIAVYDKQFNHLKTVQLGELGQVEGICIDKDRKIWLSREKSVGFAAAFWLFGEVSQYLAPAD